MMPWRAAARPRGTLIALVNTHAHVALIAAVAQPHDLLRAELVPTVGIGDQHEVVLGAVTLDEGVVHGRQSRRVDKRSGAAGHPV